MVTVTDVVIFILIVAGGIMLESIFQQLYFKYTGKKLKKYHFSWSKYFCLLIPIIIAVVLYTIKFSASIVIVFLLFSLIGTFLEWLIGYLYHAIMGQRLWTYHRKSIGGYTSLLSIPLWGLAGVLFWLLAKLFI